MNENEKDCGYWQIQNLPYSWTWANFEYCFQNITSSNKKLKQKSYLELGKYPVIDQGKDIIGGYCNDENLVYKGSLPVIVFGDHSRCVKFINTKFVQGADGVKIFKPKPLFIDHFAYWALRTINLPDKGYSRHFKFLKASKIPIPPLNEQKRIVAKIEALQTRSTAVKEELKAIKPLLNQTLMMNQHRHYWKGLGKKEIEINLKNLRLRRNEVARQKINN